MRWILIVLLLLPNICYAEKQAFSSVGMYIMSQDKHENMHTAKDKAKKDALRLLSEQACVMIDSVSVTKDYQLTDDEVQLFSAAALEITSEKYSMTQDNASIIFRCFITARADLDAVKNYLDNKLEAKQQRKKNVSYLFTVKYIDERPILFESEKKALTDTEQRASDLIRQAKTKPDNEKIFLYLKAIDIAPSYYESYLRLACLYYDLDKKQDAELILDKAIEHIKTDYLPMEIQTKVNYWYMKNGYVHGDYDFVMQSIYEIKNFLNGIKPEIITEQGAEGEEIVKVKTYVRW